MKKLKLEIDALEVESFDASGTRAEAGTVHGRGETAGCDSLRICGPTDPSYDPCPVTSTQCDSDGTWTVCTCGDTCNCTEPWPGSPC
jgi:hypothetical protein